MKCQDVMHFQEVLEINKTADYSQEFRNIILRAEEEATEEEKADFAEWFAEQHFHTLNGIEAHTEPEHHFPCMEGVSWADLAPEEYGRTMFLIFSHTLTDEQKEDAHEAGVTDFCEMPGQLLARWEQVPAEAEGVAEHIAPVLDWLRDSAYPEDYVLVAGDLGATFYVVDTCRREGLGIPVYATTRREVEEAPQEDGSIRKTSIFRHVRFRKFGV